MLLILDIMCLSFRLPISASTVFRFIIFIYHLTPSCVCVCVFPCASNFSYSKSSLSLSIQPNSTLLINNNNIFKAFLLLVCRFLAPFYVCVFTFFVLHVVCSQSNFFFKEKKFGLNRFLFLFTFWYGRYLITDSRLADSLPDCLNTNINLYTHN